VCCSLPFCSQCRFFSKPKHALLFHKTILVTSPLKAPLQPTSTAVRSSCVAVMCVAIDALLFGSRTLFKFCVWLPTDDIGSSSPAMPCTEGKRHSVKRYMHRNCPKGVPAGGRDKLPASPSLGCFLGTADSIPRDRLQQKRVGNNQTWRWGGVGFE